MIPKIIIQTWKTRDLPDHYKHNQQLLMKYNPTYQYMFFDDNDIIKFINENYPEMINIIKKFTKVIQVIDLFRLLVIYKFGGFYFDMDFKIEKSLDPLLSETCVFPAEMLKNDSILQKYNKNYNIGNYAFAASVNNPVILAIINNIDKAVSDPNWAQIPKSINNNEDPQHTMVYYTTGPIIVSRTVFEHLNSVKILFPSNWSYNYRERYPVDSWFRFGDYGVHTMTGTWKDNNIEHMTCDNNIYNSDTIFLIIVILFIIFVIYCLIKNQ